MHLLLALVVLFGWPWPVCSRVVFFLGLLGSTLLLLLFLGFGVVVASSLVCSGGLGACRRPDGSVGMALILPALTDCRWWFESLLVHSGVSSATRRKATGADQKKKWRLGCLRCDLLFPGFPPSLPPWLSSGAFWSSQSCWSLPPDIWSYLRRSGCHTFGMACRGYWLVSSLRFMATKASALCGALPSPPCSGCCSCATRCGAEVFALG